MNKFKKKSVADAFIRISAFLFLVFFFEVMAQQENVEAAYQDFSGNAETFYDLYGADNMKFFPTSVDNGKIYFCSKGKTSAASSGIKFRTVGWQFHLKNTRTGESAYLYYKRDGSLIEQRTGDSITSADGYTYNLYYISLKKGIKDRLDSHWLSAFTSGEVELKVNACMTIVVNGVAKGSIDDYGNTTGTVYKTYDGIAGAAGWSSGTKESLKSYFNKTIQGLFYKVTLVRGNGISGVVGAGTFPYGAKVQLRANIASGYQWNTGRGSKWTGSDGYSSTLKDPSYTVGNHDVTLQVDASNNYYTIYLQCGSQISSKKVKVAYGSTVTLPKVAECGFQLQEGYTYDRNKAWAVIRKSDDAIFCRSKGWVTSWRNGATTSGEWNKYIDGCIFPVDYNWINLKGNAHGDDSFTFILQQKRATTVKVVFHKNYPGVTDETYSETYTYGVSGQYFGMNLSSAAAKWKNWNKSPEGYYLPGDTEHGGGWSADPNAASKQYSLNSSVADSWIKSAAPEIHLYMVRPVKKVTVIFHKNDGSNTTYSESYTYNAGSQRFGMYLYGANTGFSHWKRSGYSGILGWAESAAAKEKKYSTSSKVTNSWINQNSPEIHLYAVWRSTIQIIVDPNGGIWNGSDQVQQYTKQKGELLALPYPTRAGYTFLGWTWMGANGPGTRSSIAGFSNSPITQTESNAVISYNGSGHYTNYKWTVNTASASDAWNRLTAGTYPIAAGHTYRISGDIRVNSGSPTGVRIYHGGKENDYENEKACYYAGSGWKSFSFDRTFSSAGTGYFEFVTTNFKNKTGTLSFDLKNLKVLDVTTGKYMVLDQINSANDNTGDLLVTANWQANNGIPYKVYHYLMNTSGSGYSLWKTESGQGVAGSALLLADLKKAPEGFTAPSYMMVDKQKVVNTTIKGNGSTEIYLYYDRNKYTLTVKEGSGIQDAVIEGRDGNTASVYYGAEVTVMAEVSCGYIWNQSAGWTGTISSGSQNFSFTMPAKNVTMTVKAPKISYTITYHLDGGTVKGNPDTYTVEDAFTLKNPEKEGYAFQGWTGSNGEVPETVAKIRKGTTGNLHFYANWEGQEYHLSVNGFLNGTDEGHLLDSLYDQTREQNIGTFDVWIKKPGEDWYQDAAHVTEYSRSFPFGTSWEIKNIEGKTYENMFYTYDGVKSGKKGEQPGTLEGTLYASQWVVPVFTSWHKLRIGGYCDGQSQDSVEGYGTFDITISGKNALGQEIADMGAGYTGSKIAGNDVTSWEGYYPQGSQLSISDIKKDPSHINSEEYAEIIYEGIYDIWNDAGNNNETETSGNIQGSLATNENTYSAVLTREKTYMLWFTGWYETILDQQGATTPGTEKIWHTITKAAYYKKAGEKSALETIVVPQRYGFVFRGYFTEANGAGIQYIDQNGKFINDLCKQKKSQKLYAFWTSEPPVISAGDSYFSLEEALNGKITEEELLSMAEAWDEEEGKLQPGDQSGTIFGLEGFEAEMFLSLDRGMAVPVTYIAKDQAGNVCKKTVCVYIVDTIPQILTKSGGKIRFISKEYLECQESQGGLMEGSIWKTEEFYKVLCKCFEN